MILRPSSRVSTIFRPKSIKHLLPSSTRHATTSSSTARLNLPVDFNTTPLLNHTSSSALAATYLPPSSPSNDLTTTRQNLYQAINSALSHSLSTDPNLLIFGEDVSFGGVFRCTTNLASTFTDARVFNTPLSEQGLVGFAIGAACQGSKVVAEVQFADYVYPAFDQLVNEAAKIRYRAGRNADEMNCGGLVVRMPCGAVGHGALYHSQSPEALFTHIPGLKVVVPRGPSQAKGLLLASVQSKDPVVFMEPKVLYRAAVEHVPDCAYEIELCKAEVLIKGKDVTIVAYGTMLYTCMDAIVAAEKEFGCRVELIDLKTIYPWDRPTIINSVNKTGRLIVVHESMANAGVGAEIAATVQDKCFLRLESPVQRVAGWSTHSGLVFEKFNIPDVVRVYDAIKKALEYDYT